MATLEVEVDLIDRVTLDSIEAGFETHISGNKRPQIVIDTKDDLRLRLYVPSAELADLLEMVWLAHEYGGDGEDEAETLADLRAALVARKARWLAAAQAQRAAE